MSRAILVAFSRSLAAPVEKWSKTRSSAARPPIARAIVASSSFFETQYLSSVGRVIVTPSAPPRGMIETLCTGSLSSSTIAISA